MLVHYLNLHSVYVFPFYYPLEAHITLNFILLHTCIVAEHNQKQPKKKKGWQLINDLSLKVFNY